MSFKSKNQKKEYQSNSPLKKDDYKGNIFEDESNLQEKTKQSIESQDQQDNNFSNVEEASFDEMNHMEMSDLSEEIEDLDVGSQLKRLLKKIKNSIKRKKKKKFSSEINNDRAPSLGNEALTESSLSESEVKKRRSILSSISNAIIRNASLRSQIRKESKNLQDVSMQDVNKDGIVNQSDISLEKSAKIEKEHMQQLADAINDIGESEKKGRWADSISDTSIKAKKGGGISR